MTRQEVAQMIAEMGIPYAYYQFPHGTEQAPPFVCFFYSQALPLVSLFRLDWRAECMVLGASLLIYGLVGLAAILLVNMTEME